MDARITPPMHVRPLGNFSSGRSPSWHSVPKDVQPVTAGMTFPSYDRCLCPCIDEGHTLITSHGRGRGKKRVKGSGKGSPDTSALRPAASLPPCILSTITHLTSVCAHLSGGDDAVERGRECWGPTGGLRALDLLLPWMCVP